MKSFREFLDVHKDDIKEEISEGVRGTNLSDKDFREFSKLLSDGVKFIKDELKDGNIGDVVGRTESLATTLLKWVEKLKKSDIR